MGAAGDGQIGQAGGAGAWAAGCAAQGQRQLAQHAGQATPQGATGRRAGPEPQQGGQASVGIALGLWIDGWVGGRTGGRPGGRRVAEQACVQSLGHAGYGRVCRVCPGGTVAPSAPGLPQARGRDVALLRQALQRQADQARRVGATASGGQQRRPPAQPQAGQGGCVGTRGECLGGQGRGQGRGQAGQPGASQGRPAGV